MSNIHVPMVIVLLSYFSKYWAWHSDICTDSHMTAKMFAIDELLNFLRYGADPLKITFHVWNFIKFKTIAKLFGSLCLFYFLL